MIYTLTLNPAIDWELQIKHFELNSVSRSKQSRIDCGGKGFNVSRMLRNLNTDSIAMGFVGGTNGERLESGLQEQGITTDFTWIQGETRTNVSIVAADNAEHIKVNEPGPTITEADLAKLMQKVREQARPGDGWVLAGSLPPGVPPTIYAEMITILRSAGAHVFLDTSGEALYQSCEAKPFIVKPNAEEAQELTGLPINNPVEIAAAGAAIQSMGPENVIISLGREGALLINGQKAWLAASPEIVEHNPIGAGDSMVAGLVWGLSQGHSMSEALCRGIACGAATASQNGTSVGTLAQVKELLTQVQLSEV